jgi:hypothetical protein
MLQLAEIELFGTPSGQTFSTQIEAESFATMSGVQTEVCSEGGSNVGWIDTGDWMVWNVNIPAAGTHTVEYRVASLSGGGTIRLEQAGGATIFGSIAVPGTGGWQNWTTISHNVNLRAGQQQIAIAVPAGGWNINWLKISKSGAARIDLNDALRTTAEANEISVYPLPAANDLTISGLQADSEVAVYDLTGKLILSKTRLSPDHPVINIKALKPGTYLLKAEGRACKVLRFVKE